MLIAEPPGATVLLENEKWRVTWDGFGLEADLEKEEAGIYTSYLSIAIGSNRLFAEEKEPPKRGRGRPRKKKSGDRPSSPQPKAKRQKVGAKRI